MTQLNRAGISGRLVCDLEEPSADPQQPLIGIVVPVFKEVVALKRTLERLRRVAGHCPVVVVDGGSTDGSVSIARRLFHIEVCGEANRGAQLNLGARHLDTDVLLFLHVDPQLPFGFQFYIRQALHNPRVAGGCFRLTFDDSHPMLCFYAWFTQFPGRFLHFGDQGFFVRREIFHQMKGYRRLPFMEDVDFLRRLRCQGRFVVLSAPVATSARRFLRCGVVRQQLLNIFLVTLFELGISAKQLSRLYPHIR